VGIRTDLRRSNLTAIEEKAIMDSQEFINELLDRINARRKMTSRLYQVILEGKATQRLLQNFVIHRYPIKNLWVRHLMATGGRIEDHKLRRLFVENAYEEETGGYTHSDRHVETFLALGECVGVSRETVMNAPLMPETQAVVDHNLRACNDTTVPMTEGAASVLLLMEGQPPIVNKNGDSMEAVMRDIYGLPPRGYEFFTHHASSGVSENHVSALEDEHTAAVVELLKQYCTSEELQQGAIRSLDRAIDLRHAHFNMVYERFYDPSEPVFRYRESEESAAPPVAV
jgi:pyrroloquinoline-quinone synthase